MDQRHVTLGCGGGVAYFFWVHLNVLLDRGAAGVFTSHVGHPYFNNG